MLMLSHCVSACRSSRSQRVSRSSRHTLAQQRSIAETEEEATGTDGDADAERAPASPASSEGGSEGEQMAAQTQQNRYSFSSAGFTRSPYVTRSTSKTRPTVSRTGGHHVSFTSSLAAAASRALHRVTGHSPTKALSFNEEDEEDDGEEAIFSDESSDTFNASPLRRGQKRRGTGRMVPNTPGERFAHRDAGVYQQDVCESHEVRMADGSIRYKPHECENVTHKKPRSPARPQQRYFEEAEDEAAAVPAPRPAAAAPAAPSSGRSSGLAWYVFLSMLLLGLLSPWAVKQLTHRPPDFVEQQGKTGALMTQGQPHTHTHCGS